MGKRLSTFAYSLSHQTPNFGFFPTSTAKIPSWKSLATTAPPICRQFNSPTGCQWPNCRFRCLRIMPNCIQPHPQYAHANSPRDIHVPIHPSNYNAIGIARKFSGGNHTSYICYCKLPFGALKSWEMFHRIIQSTTTMMTRRGFRTVLGKVHLI